MTTLTSPFGNAGWYPNDKDELTSTITELLDNNMPSDTNTTATAIISPHAGYAYCGHICANAFKPTQDQDIHHIIIIGPSHYVNLEHHYAIPTATQFSTEIGTSQTQASFLSSLNSDNAIKHNDLFFKEHSIWMMLPFIHHLHPNARISPIIVGQLNEDNTHALANKIKPKLNKHTLLIISSDFTHYGTSFNYAPFTDNIPNNIKKVDDTAFEFIQNKDATGFWQWFHDTPTTICGRYAIAIMLACLRNETLISTHYTQSGEITQDWGHSVSYRSAAFGKDLE